MTCDDLHICLKIAGSGLSGIGSLLLAWRVKAMIQWIIYSVVAHEVSIDQIQRLVSGQHQTQPIIQGMPKHLLRFQDKAGFALLILGFVSLGIGMLLNMILYLGK